MPIPTPNKTYTVPASGHTYGYIHYLPTSYKPTLLFLHGFPSTSHDWRHQITHFSTLGYGILAPDLLGYGSSSKPSSVEDYLGSIIAADIISILDHAKIIGGVIAIGHDWGTYPLSQLAFRYQDRFEKFVFLSVAYGPPGQRTDIKTLNEVTRKLVGYEQFGYWLFLTEEGAGKVIGKHWESFFDIAYAADPSLWKDHFAPTGTLKEFLTSDSHTPVGNYITPEEKAHHYAIFGDDYSACVNWYKRGITNLGFDEEKKSLEQGKFTSKIAKETLMIGGLKDAVLSAERAAVSMKASVEEGKLKVVNLDAGHWIMLELAEETNRVLEEFLQNGVKKVAESEKASL